MLIKLHFSPPEKQTDSQDSFTVTFLILRTERYIYHFLFFYYRDTHYPFSFYYGDTHFPISFYYVKRQFLFSLFYGHRSRFLSNTQFSFSITTLLTEIDKKVQFQTISQLFFPFLFFSRRVKIKNKKLNPGCKHDNTASRYIKKSSPTKPCHINEGRLKKTQLFPCLRVIYERSLCMYEIPFD